MQREYQRLKKEILDLQSKLSKLPEGKLICARNGKYSRWYQSDGHTKKYIPKENRKLAEKLAEKKYLTILLNNAIGKKKAIQNYLKCHQKNLEEIEALFSKSPEYKNLINAYFKIESTELAEWANAPYEQNKSHPERLIYKSVSGKFVRSKSEVIIDMCLYENKIPFHYEEALNLGGIRFYPDFTICHPKTGNIYYWEHFGRMDDPGYVKKTCIKLERYVLNGIIPSVQLITTFETMQYPLDIEEVKRIIEHYFVES